MDPFLVRIPKDNGYTLVLYQCPQCDQIYPHPHTPDCPSPTHRRPVTFKSTEALKREAQS